MTSRPDPLGRLIDAARDVVGTSDRPTAASAVTLTAGPCPIVLRGTSTKLLTTFAGALVASAPPSVPSLDICVVSATEVDPNLIPDALRPGPHETIIARDESRCAVATGLHDTLWILDPVRAVAVLWTDDPQKLPIWELASPLFVPLSWWASEHGAALVHTGAVADADGAVLLVGDSGAGKSTTSLACLGQGLEVIGDDCCLIGQPMSESEAARVHGLYRSAKLDDRSLGLLPHLTERIVGPGPRQKHLIDLAHDHVDPKPIRAICQIVQRPGATSHLLPLSPARALHAVAPQTIAMQRLWERQVWQVLAALARTVPCYQLVVGAPSEAPGVLIDLLAHRAEETSASRPKKASGPRAG